MTTKAPRGKRSASGVFVLENFRDNLIIDRYDPIFAGMRASKLKHLCSANSEDAITWNVFRTLRQIDPARWLPTLVEAAFQEKVALEPTGVTVRLWQTVAPPQGLLRDGDEGDSEIDIALEAPAWVWFIEAKYKSDISTRTTTRADRDQLIRNIDVGSFYAGVRDYYFSLLVLNPKRSHKGADAIKRYADVSLVRKALPHRRDGLSNLEGVGMLTWADTASALAACTGPHASPLEQSVSARALEWLKTKGIQP